MARKPLFARLYNQLNHQMVTSIGLLTHEVLTVAQSAADACGGTVEAASYSSHGLNVDIDNTRDLSEDDLEAILASALEAGGLSATIKTHTHSGSDHTWRHAVAYTHDDRVRFDVCSTVKTIERREAA